MERYRHLTPGDNFRSVFVGLYLPVRHRNGYANVVDKIGAVDPAVYTSMDSSNSHVTLLSMGIQSRRAVLRTMEIIAGMIKELKGQTIKIAGFNQEIFDSPNPNLLWSLNVEDSNILKGFAWNLRDRLQEVTRVKKEPPKVLHMTAALSNRHLLGRVRDRIAEILDGTSWVFELNELTIFGKPENTEDNWRFRTLATIPVKSDPKDYIHSRSHPHARRFRGYHR